MGLEQNRIYLGDCLEVMKEIDDKSTKSPIRETGRETENGNENISFSCSMQLLQ